MKVAIDAFPLSGRIAGIARYVLEICHSLDNLIPEASFLLYSPEALNVLPPSPRWAVRVRGSRVGSSYMWLKSSARAMAEDDGADVFWATRTILPSRSNTFRTVATVHDLNYRVFPRSMPHATLWAHRLWFAADVRRADCVVTNSQGTADRLHTLLGVDAGAVARPGVCAPFEIQPAAGVADRLASLSVDGPYFLAVGTIEPRKNLAVLVQAFVSLKRQGRLKEHALLIAGSAGWRDRRLRALIEEARTTDVRWLGFVSDEDLAALYAGASAFVFPSLYEGFGIPALEARACGARIVATDIPELREAAGPGGIYVEPTIQGISEGLLGSLAPRTPPVSPRSLISGWEEAASTMAEVFRRVASSGVSAGSSNLNRTSP